MSADGMTVASLVAELLKMPPGDPVFMQCNNLVGRVRSVETVAWARLNRGVILR